MGIRFSLYPQILLSIFLLLVSIIFFEYTSADLIVEQFFYDYNAHHWLINQNQALLKFIFYDGVKALFVLFLLTLIVLIFFTDKFQQLKPYKKGMIIVLISCICVVGFVNFLKAITNTPCPKQITEFEGDYPYSKLFDTVDLDTYFRCWPAGHASGGFALMSLFFLFRGRKAKIAGLVTGISIGWSTGLYKMLIGDHFLSHTVDSMLIAWIIILMVVSAYNKRITV
ncbi:MAG: phosphatase PAP2 family protein [Gammaproteobacteria bacterium]|nr:phosphatase PAP2 family protein [Gammaproteobacteria bacterium]